MACSLGPLGSLGRRTAVQPCPSRMLDAAAIVLDYSLGPLHSNKVAIPEGHDSRTCRRAGVQVAVTSSHPTHILHPLTHTPRVMPRRAWLTAAAKSGQTLRTPPRGAAKSEQLHLG